MRILAIANPYAAGGRSLRRMTDLRGLLARSPHELEWAVTDSVAEMRERIERARSSGFEGVLLIGGDGTVHDALPALAAEGLPFGIVPCGRGNDFARNVGIPLNVGANLLLESQPARRRIDLPTVNGAPFGSIACIGFDAEVNRLARDGRGHFAGTVGYLVCVLRALPGFRPFEVEIQLEGRRWSGTILMLAVANGPCYGGGMRMAPGAVMDDGKLDVCLVEALPKLELLRNMPKVFRGTHTTHPRVTVARASSIAVSSVEPKEIYADGEFVGTTPAVWEIGEHTVELLLPTEVVTQ